MDPIFAGSEGMLLDEENAILKYGHQFCDYLAKGLADNWSQVSEILTLKQKKKFRFIASVDDMSAHNYELK